MGSDCGRKTCDSHACLTERLAQAERERDEWKAAAEFRQATIQDLRAERDAALERAESAEMRLSDGVSPHDCRRIAEQRDAALAKAEQAIADRMDFAEKYAARQTAKADELTRKHQHSEAGRMAAVGRAEAAEKEVMEWVDAFNAKHSALADLRARIEALADEYGGSRVANAIRALLTPPKAETALELVTALEKMALCGPTGNTPTEALAKLRTLLQAASPSP